MEDEKATVEAERGGGNKVNDKNRWQQGSAPAARPYQAARDGRMETRRDDDGSSMAQSTPFTHSRPTRIETKLVFEDKAAGAPPRRLPKFGRCFYSRTPFSHHLPYCEWTCTPPGLIYQTSLHLVGAGPMAGPGVSRKVARTVILHTPLLFVLPKSTSRHI